MIFFNNVGYLGMCGHGAIGVAVTLAHLGRIGPGTHRLETPVGTVQVEFATGNEVTIENVASYRHRAEVPGIGPLTGDVAWGGNLFFCVHQAPLELDMTNIGELTRQAEAVALLHICMSFNQPVLLVGVASGLLAGVLAPSLVPLLLTVFLLTLGWVLVCTTTFLRAGHNFIRGGEMSPARFGLVLLRFVGGQVAMLVRSLGVHVAKRFEKPKPVVFDRTPKKGA